MTKEERFIEKLTHEPDTKYIKALYDLARGHSANWVVAALREELEARDTPDECGFMRGAIRV